MITSSELIKYTKNLKLLYVEDNQSAMDATLFVFEEFFDSIIIAKDGKEGLEKFKLNQDINIVISDIHMPNMNGFDMIKSIKRIKQDIAVLVFSAYSDKEYLNNAIDLGIDGYLLKPLDFTQLLQSLDKCLKKLKKK